MLTIRLQRVGKTKFATYRVILSEKNKDPQARHLEILGNFNPHDKEKGLVLKADRIKYWLGKGVQTSNTIFNLFLKAGLVEGKKKKSVTISKTRAAKMNQVKADEQAKKEKEQAVKASEEKPAEVTEEVKAE